jgi:replication factor A2
VQLVQALSGSYSENQVRTAVTKLVEEGHLYSTIDEEHFKHTG